MLTLERIGATRVYAEPSQSPGPGFAAYVVTATGGALPAVLAAAQAWSDPALRGYFLFLPAAVSEADRAAFASAVELSGAFPDPAHTSFAWLTFTPPATLGAPARLPIEAPEGAARVAADSDFRFARYGLTLKQGSPVFTSFEQDALVAFTFAFPPGDGRPAPNGQGVTLPLGGAGRFCFEGEALLGDLSDDPVAGWDVAPRFFAGAGAALSVLRFPLFEPLAPGVHLVVRVRWDPLTRWWAPGAAAPARTELALTELALTLHTTGGAAPVSSLGPAAPPVLDTFLRTIYGDRVRLRPVVGSARFVLQPVGRGANAAAYYLVPAGEFELQLEPGAPARAARLLCGLGGTEFASFTPGADRLCFHPDRPAFAPGWVAGPARSPRPATAGDLLTDDFVTAWVSLRRAGSAGADPVYFAQPDSAPLFFVEEGAPRGVLSLFDAAAADLDGARVFPMVPYAGLAGVPEQERERRARFETDVLSPTRKRRTLDAAATAARTSAATAAPLTTATPQGFLVTLEGRSWKSVQLASATRSNGARQELRFRDVDGPLREALQSNQLFLVISSGARLPAFDNLISIVDWPFRIDPAVNPPGASSFRNVLLFKFGDGTLRERVADLATWSQAATFNEDPAAVQLWIEGYFAQAEQAAKTTPRLRRFVERLDDAAWNGVLALRVDIEPAHFPDDLKGLIAGLDLTQFAAHHFGIELSFVTDAGGLQSPSSSLFGLINYVDRDLPAGRTAAAPPLVLVDGPADPGYDFRVLNLLVAFENSEVVDFNSRIVLTLTRLFDELARRADEVPIPVLENTFELLGSYQNQNGVAYYLFQGERATRFLTPDSHVLNYAELLKAQFHTFRARPAQGLAAGDATTVASRFTFWGVLNFKKLAGLDTLSFGNPDGGAAGPAAGLAFSELGIGMTFELNAPRETRRFDFDVSQVAFDLGQSRARAGSLFRGFPLRLAGLAEGGAQRTPEAAGFLPVGARFEDTQPLDTARWFGLVFPVSLGTLGALAAQVGFTARLLAAWSPGGETPRVAVFIQLPGTGVGKRELSLESVLKLAVGQFSLSRDASDPSKLHLVFADIKLSFLGLKLPASAYTELALFGDPAAAQQGGNLAWYAGWFQPPKPQAEDEGTGA